MRPGRQLDYRFRLPLAEMQDGLANALHGVAPRVDPLVSEPSWLFSSSRAAAGAACGPCRRAAVAAYAVLAAIRSVLRFALCRNAGGFCRWGSARPTVAG